MESTIKIEKYSRKRPFRHRQYYWRAIARNGRIIATSGEGYNNRSDRDLSLYRLRVGMEKAETVTND